MVNKQHPLYKMSAFDIFQKAEEIKRKFQTVYPKTAVEIPDMTWKSAFNYETTPILNRNIIRAFDFNLKDEVFVGSKKFEVNSLFREYQQLTRVNVSQKFFVLNFICDEKYPGETATVTKDRLVENILRKGVTANGGKTYNIVGCSSSQLQRRSFYFMQGSLEDCEDQIHEFIPNLHDLERKKGVEKRTKYVGLLFTGCQYIVDLPKNAEFQVIQNSDIENNGFNFTDGCGSVSYQLANWIWNNNPQLQKKWKTLPSVWQIRYYGKGALCKGVLVVDYGDKNRRRLVLRPSLMKIEGIHSQNVSKLLENKLGIVSATTRPLEGKLNKQVIALLSSTIAPSHLLSIQESHLREIRNCRKDPLVALKRYAKTRQTNCFEKLLRKHAINVVPPGFVSLPGMLQQVSTEKLQVPLACARLMIGAAFPKYLHEYLKEGQCVVLNEFGFVQGNNGHLSFSFILRFSFY